MIPFKQRVAVFQQLIAADKRTHDPLADANIGGGRQAKVKRSTIVQDAFDHLKGTKRALKRRVQVTFVSEQGLEEVGIDGGGLFKEFMDCLCKAAFDVKFGLFAPTASQLLAPNPDSIRSVVGEQHLEYFEFLGRILGKAMYERILIESRFAGVFLNVLLGRQNTLDDLWYLDEQVR